MPGAKRSDAETDGRRLARIEATKAGSELRAARKRRRLTQEVIARRAGISRSRLAEMEGGDGFHASLDHWFAIAKALGLYLKFELGRDPRHELRDAGHLDIQELVVRVAAQGGWKPEWESQSGRRWIDVRLEDRQRRRMLIVECINTLGDLGQAMRSSDFKVREAETRSSEVGLLWVVRDSMANRQLVNRYEALLESRFAGSSVAWLQALVVGSPMPAQPGLVWSDLRATRLFARRRSR